MTFKTKRIHHAWSLEDIFGEGMWCPYCHGESFTYLEGHSITCDRCDAEFTLHMTGGDTGVVVKAFAAETKFVTIHRTFWIEPGRARTRDNTSCTMVLKVCECGLDNRNKWYTPFQTEHTNLLYRDDDEPLGLEVFYYKTRDAARHLAHERWLETKAGREAKEQGLHTFDIWDWPEGLYDTYRQYMRHWQDKLTKHLRGDLGLEDGYYWPAQTVRTFDNAFWITRCIPREGEVPILTESGWPRTKG